jgi:N-acetylglutamate synthase-like GNAT family acetyltransferase
MKKFFPLPKNHFPNTEGNKISGNPVDKHFNRRPGRHTGHGINYKENKKTHSLFPNRHFYSINMVKPSKTRIRDFKENDIEDILELISVAIDNSYRHFYPLQAINFFKALYSGERILARSKKGKTLVLEKEGNIVGVGFILAGEILGVFINPAFQHQGYGKSLMIELEKIAISSNRPRVWLSLALPTREFFEDLGYQIIKECSIEVKSGKRLYYWTASKELKKQGS